MKIIITALLLILPVVVSAQTQGVSEADMQKYAQAMQEMMQCMAKVDQAEIAALEEESEQFEQEMESLCSQGKRKEAQEKAIAYSKEIMKNPALKQMTECGEINKKYGIAVEEDEDEVSIMDSEFDFSKHHVCDDFGTR